MSRTIAVIDDSVTIRSILRKAVMMSNIDAEEVLEADNGLDGLDLIKRSKEKLNLVIMDLKMPKMDGISLLTELKAAGIQSIPILVLSSTADQQMQDQCRTLGASAFLKKPFSHEDFKIVLDRILTS